MSKVVLLNKDFSSNGETSLPENFKGINAHNLYLYVKSYRASVRANSADARKRGEVSGGGKKPWSQKGGGRARAGSITSPVFVGGGKAHGPSNDKNYTLKVNKKQKKLALNFALNEKAEQNRLFVVDEIAVASGKTKDAANLLNSLNVKDALFVCSNYDFKTFISFRNIPNCYLIEQNELNAYVASAYSSIIIEKSVFENIVQEG